MTPALWSYPSPLKQTVYYRGYVKEYKNSTIIIHPCKKVHQNKAKALNDASLLIKSLK